VDMLTPGCFSKSVILDREIGEYVCANCGFVIDEETESKISSDIPFGTENKPNAYALTSHIAYGKSLGFNMPKSHFFRVIAKARYAK